MQWHRTSYLISLAAKRIEVSCSGLLIGATEMMIWVWVRSCALFSNSSRMRCKCLQRLNGVCLRVLSHFFMLVSSPWSCYSRSSSAQGSSVQHSSSRRSDDCASTTTWLTSELFAFFLSWNPASEGISNDLAALRWDSSWGVEWSAWF